MRARSRGAALAPTPDGANLGGSHPGDGECLTPTRLGLAARLDDTDLADVVLVEESTGRTVVTHTREGATTSQGENP